MMIQLTPLIFRAKSKWYEPKKVKKLASNSQLLTVQILTNDVQVLILCLSYFITTLQMVLRPLAKKKFPLFCSSHFVVLCLEPKYFWFEKLETICSSKISGMDA